MSFLRQNTDYALRVMVHLAHSDANSCISARTLAKEQDISYHFACKILQKLHEAKLVVSTMGQKGGYKLGKVPDQINMFDIVTAMQGPLIVNRCIDINYDCPRKPGCPVHDKCCKLQGIIREYLTGITLKNIAE